MASTINASTSPAAIVQTADGTAILALQTGNTTAVTIDASQNVGIGTASPSTRLHVKGGNDNGIYADNTGQQYSGLGLYNNGTRKASVSWDNTNTQLQIFNDGATSIAFGTSGTERMRIDTSGNVRINTTTSIGSSTERLGILQTNTSSDIITVRNSGATAGKYWSAPYVDTSNTYYIINNSSTGVKLTDGATSWAAQSDARLKNITGTYTNALSDIAQIQPVKFTWKEDPTNKAQVGVIAQSVLLVVPEAVESIATPKSEDKTEYLSVRYTELIPLMIAAIQEQQALITSLTARITALEGA